MKKRRPTNSPCPCGGISYGTCCQPYHLGKVASDAVTLMRSRYSAFVLKLEPYLLETWHPETRPATLDLAQGKINWIGLEVRQQEVTGPDAASVEFIARYKVGGRAHRLHEVSRFVREQGRWFYLDGEFPEPASV